MTSESEDRAANFLKAVSAVYDMGGMVLSDGLPGDALRHEIKDEAEQSKIGSYFRLLNEAIFLARYRAYYYMSAIAGEKEATLDYMFAVRAARTALAIRVLCGRGLDVDARMLLRNLYELSLLKCKILLEPAVRAEYSGATTPKAANNFWHRHIKGGKLRTFVEERTKQLNMPWLGAVNDGSNLDQIEQIAGLTSHPTFLAKSFDVRDDIQNFGVSDKVEPTQASKFTLQSTILCMSLAGTLELKLGPHYDAPDLMTDLNPYPAPKEPIGWNEYHRRFPTVEFGLCILAFAARSQEEKQADDAGAPQKRQEKTPTKRAE